MVRGLHPELPGGKRNPAEDETLCHLLPLGNHPLFRFFHCPQTGGEGGAAGDSGCGELPYPHDQDVQEGWGFVRERRKRKPRGKGVCGVFLERGISQILSHHYNFPTVITNAQC